MSADGSGITRLTDNPEGDWSPSWSPDGRRIAFTSDRNGNRDIYVINADGSGLTRLTDHPGPDYSPSWSPAGPGVSAEALETATLSGRWDIMQPQAGTGGLSAVVSLAWEEVPGAGGYVVLRRKGAQSEPVAVSGILPATTTSYTDRTPTAGESYEYVLDVKRPDGQQGSRSDGVQIQIPPDLSQVPEKPRLLISWNMGLGAERAGITVWWGPTARAGGYQLDRRVDGGAWEPMKFVFNTFSDYSLPPGLYEYRLRGRNRRGLPGPWSDVAQARLEAGNGVPPSGAPRVGLLNINQRQVPLAWTQASGATSYEMQRCVDSEEEKSFQESAIVEGVTSAVHLFTHGATYVVASVALSKSGEFLLSDFIHHVCVSNRWISAGSIFTETAVTDGSVATGRYYYYKVRGWNAAGPGGWSNVVQVSPGKPNLHLLDATKSSVTLGWTGVDGATSYDIDDCGGWSNDRLLCRTLWEHRPTASRSFYTKRIDGLRPGAAYFFRVRSQNEDGPSYWSDIVEVIVGVPLRPPAVRAEMASDRGAYEVRLSWEGVANASRYEVRRRDATGAQTTFGVPGLEYTDQEILYEGVYSYSVRGVSAHGEGPWSSETLTRCSMMQHGGCLNVEWDGQ